MAAALSDKARDQSRQQNSTGLSRRANGGATGSGDASPGRGHTAGREPQAPAMHGSKRPARPQDPNARVTRQKRGLGGDVGRPGNLQSGALAGQSVAGGEGQDAAGEALRRGVLPDPASAATPPAVAAGADDPLPAHVAEQLLRTGQLVWSAGVAGRLLALLREQLGAAGTADGAQGFGLGGAVLGYAELSHHFIIGASVLRWAAGPAAPGGGGNRHGNAGCSSGDSSGDAHVATGLMDLLAQLNSRGAMTAAPGQPAAPPGPPLPKAPYPLILIRPGSCALRGAADSSSGGAREAEGRDSAGAGAGAGVVANRDGGVWCWWALHAGELSGAGPGRPCAERLDALAVRVLGPRGAAGGPPGPGSGPTPWAGCAALQVAQQLRIMDAECYCSVPQPLPLSSHAWLTVWQWREQQAGQDAGYAALQPHPAQPNAAVARRYHQQQPQPTTGGAMGPRRPTQPSLQLNGGANDGAEGLQEAGPLTAVTGPAAGQPDAAAHLGGRNTDVERAVGMGMGCTVGVAAATAAAVASMAQLVVGQGTAAAHLGAGGPPDPDTKTAAAPAVADACPDPCGAPVAPLVASLAAASAAAPAAAPAGPPAAMPAAAPERPSLSALLCALRAADPASAALLEGAVREAAATVEDGPATAPVLVRARRTPRGRPASHAYGVMCSPRGVSYTAPLPRGKSQNETMGVLCVMPGEGQSAAAGQVGKLPPGKFCSRAAGPALGSYHWAQWLEVWAPKGGQTPAAQGGGQQLAVEGATEKGWILFAPWRHRLLELEGQQALRQANGSVPQPQQPHEAAEGGVTGSALAPPADQPPAALATDERVLGARPRSVPPAGASAPAVAVDGADQSAPVSGTGAAAAAFTAVPRADAAVCPGASASVLTAAPAAVPVAAPEAPPAAAPAANPAAAAAPECPSLSALLCALRAADPASAALLEGAVREAAAAVEDGPATAPVLVRARSTPRDRLASYGYGVMYCPPGVTYAEGAHGRFGYRVRVLSAGRGEEQQGAAAVQHQSPEEFCANVSGDAQGMYHWTQWMQVWAPDGASGREQGSWAVFRSWSGAFRRPGQQRLAGIKLPAPAPLRAAQGGAAAAAPQPKGQRPPAAANEEGRAADAEAGPVHASAGAEELPIGTQSPAGSRKRLRFASLSAPVVVPTGTRQPRPPGGVAIAQRLAVGPSSATGATHSPQAAGTGAAAAMGSEPSPDPPLLDELRRLDPAEADALAAAVREEVLAAGGAAAKAPVLVRARNTPRDCPASCGYGVMYCPSGVTHADGGQGRSGFRVRVLWAEHGPEQQSAAVVHRLSPEEFCKKVAEHLMGSYYWSQWMEVWAPDPATSETVAGAGGSGPARQGSWRLFKEWSREQRRANKRPADAHASPAADGAARDARQEGAQQRKGASDDGAGAHRTVAAPTAARAAAAAVPVTAPTTRHVKATANAAGTASRPHSRAGAEHAGYRSADVLPGEKSQRRLLPASGRGAAAASAAVEATGHHASGRGVTEPPATAAAATAGPGACSPAAASTSRLLAQLGRLDPEAAAALGDAVRELAAEAAGAADRAPVLVRARSSPRGQPERHGYGVMYCPRGASYLNWGPGVRLRALVVFDVAEAGGAAGPRAALVRVAPKDFCARVSRDTQGSCPWTLWLQVWAPDAAQASGSNQDAGWLPFAQWRLRLLRPVASSSLSQPRVTVPQPSAEDAVTGGVKVMHKDAQRIRAPSAPDPQPPPAKRILAADAGLVPAPRASGAAAAGNSGGPPKKAPAAAAAPERPSLSALLCALRAADPASAALLEGAVREAAATVEDGPATAPVLVRARRTPRGRPASHAYGVMCCPRGVSYTAPLPRGKSQNETMGVLCVMPGEGQSAAAGQVGKLPPGKFCSRAAGPALGSYHWAQWLEVWAPKGGQAPAAQGGGQQLAVEGATEKGSWLPYKEWCSALRRGAAPSCGRGPLSQTSPARAQRSERPAAAPEAASPARAAHDGGGARRASQPATVTAGAVAVPPPASSAHGSQRSPMQAAAVGIAAPSSKPRSEPAALAQLRQLDAAAADAMTTAVQSSAAEANGAYDKAPVLVRARVGSRDRGSVQWAHGVAYCPAGASFVGRGHGAKYGVQVLWFAPGEQQQQQQGPTGGMRGGGWGGELQCLAPDVFCRRVSGGVQGTYHWTQWLQVFAGGTWLEYRRWAKSLARGPSKPSPGTEPKANEQAPAANASHSGGTPHDSPKAHTPRAPQSTPSQQERLKRLAQAVQEAEAGRASLGRPPKRQRGLVG